VHDLRRSFVTHLNELGIAQPHVIEALVNHAGGHKAGICGIYNRAQYLPERQKALEKWAEILMAQVGFAVPAPQSTNPEISEELGSQLVSGTGG
jgi:hypothetical protein